MNGFIVVNAYIKNPSQISQAKRIAEELRALGVQTEIVKNVNLAAIVNSAVECKRGDFCVFLDKDKVAARLLEMSGIRLFNCAQTIELCDNKMLTHTELTKHGIPMPNSVYAPLCYYADAPVNDEFLNGVENLLGYPLVGKTNYGSLGAGVSLIKGMGELEEYEQKNKLTEHFYQQFINCGCGKDIRAIVIGGKFLCAYRRVNDGDFRSNIELGGRGERAEISADVISLSESCARSLNADYCGIDILTDEKGKNFVCEVNSNAFFTAAERVCGVNVAKAYAMHIVNNL